MSDDRIGGLVGRAEHARRVLELISADRLGAMLRFSDEEQKDAKEIIRELVDLAEGEGISDPIIERGRAYLESRP